jgi:hypothetical protein
VTGALVGGVLGVEAVKSMVGLRAGTGDLFALTVPLALALGRIGCIAAGCCPGIECEPAWWTIADAHGHARWPAAAAELAKCRATVGRFLKHLEQQPPLFALQMCFQEPDQHPMCIEAGRLLQELQLQGAAPRVVQFMGKPQHFDPCQLEIKEHTGPVRAVCFFRGAGKTGDCIASASDDGTIKITSAVSGEVVLEMQAHDGREVCCLDVCNDGTRMASGGEDGTVRVWEVSTGKCLQVLKGHRYEMNKLVCVCVCPGGRFWILPSVACLAVHFF